MKKIERALISLTDKSCIEDFARQFQDLGIEILSTGGTARKMRENGIAVKDVSEFTGYDVKGRAELILGGIACLA